jgi:hypothetical protein
MPINPLRAINPSSKIRELTYLEKLKQMLWNQVTGESDLPEDAMVDTPLGGMARAGLVVNPKNASILFDRLASMGLSPDTTKGAFELAKLKYPKITSSPERLRLIFRKTPQQGTPNRLGLAVNSEDHANVFGNVPNFFRNYLYEPPPYSIFNTTVHESIHNRNYKKGKDLESYATKAGNTAEVAYKKLMEILKGQK